MCDGDFATQADLFTGSLLGAYQASSVAVRVLVTNLQAADREQGYRPRVNMAAGDGTYKINRLDQVTS